MDGKMKILLDRLEIEKDHYNYFTKARLLKIKVKSSIKECYIYIENEDMFDPSLIMELDMKKELIAPNFNKVEIIYQFVNKNNEVYLSYFLHYPPLKIQTFYFYITINAPLHFYFLNCIQKTNRYDKLLFFHYNYSKNKK